jgi:hypothetical protein
MDISLQAGTYVPKKKADSAPDPKTGRGGGR